MKITVEDGEIVLSDVFSGIGIRTDRGLFGIAQRDGGIEVMLDGKDVWNSEHPEVTPVNDRLRAADEHLARLSARVREMEYRAHVLVTYLDSCKYININGVRKEICSLAAAIAARSTGGDLNCSPPQQRRVRWGDPLSTSPSIQQSPPHMPLTMGLIASGDAPLAGELITAALQGGQPGPDLWIPFDSAHHARCPAPFYNEATGRAWVEHRKVHWEEESWCLLHYAPVPSHTESQLVGRVLELEAHARRHEEYVVELRTERDDLRAALAAATKEPT